jgi:succinate-acetate transporter protein
VPAGANFTELGFWFIALGAITWLGAIAALPVNVALFVVLFLLAAGCTLAAIAFLDASSSVLEAAGSVFVASPTDVIEYPIGMPGAHAGQ